MSLIFDDQFRRRITLHCLVCDPASAGLISELMLLLHGALEKLSKIQDLHIRIADLEGGLDHARELWVAQTLELEERVNLFRAALTLIRDGTYDLWAERHAKLALEEKE